KGIYASALTSYVTAVKHEFTAEGVRMMPVSTEGVLLDKKLGQLLAEAKAGSKEATEQLLSLAHSAMSFEGESLRGVGDDEAIQEKIDGSPQPLRGFAMTNDAAAKLRTNLETLTTPKIGQSNDELKAALGYNM